jgi:nitrite reductase/ring-hydroxylating ferredoxin subunit
MSKIKIAKVGDIEKGKIKEYRVEGKEIAIANSDGEYKAFDAFCTHEKCSLAGGFLDGYTLTCYCHGAQFDISTGEVMAPPATVPLSTYKVSIEGDDIIIEM